MTLLQKVLLGWIQKGGGVTKTSKPANSRMLTKRPAMTQANNFRPIPERVAPYIHFQMCSICHAWACCKKEGPMHFCAVCDSTTLTAVPGRALVPRTQSLPFGSPHADYRDTRTNRPSRHLKLRLWGPHRGSVEERIAKATFHGVLKEHFDRVDYPVDPFYRTGDTHKICSVCNGLVWYASSKEPKFLRRLAHQVGLRIAVDQWRVGSKCLGWEPVEQLTATLEGSLL